MTRNSMGERATATQPLNDVGWMKKKLEDVENFKEVRLSALDDFVSVNSFTIAIFLGLSFASPNQQSLDNRPECAPGVKMEKRLVVYEVVSFACFLFSSLVAKSLKLYLSVHNTENDLDILNYRVIKPRRGFMSLLSVLASAVGVVFLTLSMVDVVQIKIGNMSCGIGETQAAVISLCTIVALALIIYLPSTVMTIIRITFVSK
ncbi:hypothetical protein P3X46_011974 [Hevea brasiliensis]|uniref:PGG domain-containing protein n=1 Tax=Hevea brasiliensis TaxID=3981 RepID=A0ABQ9M8S4_HEVBR|nr:uncharacterized protein LOC110635405 isoform X2 [Hevea brasiliensis]KAJ9176689.1 hypothetical protein P3X46_011974 [Hevea brasiliensis]